MPKVTNITRIKAIKSFMIEILSSILLASQPSSEISIVFLTNQFVLLFYQF